MHSNGKQRLASRPHATAAYGRLSKLLLAFVAVATLCGTGSLLLQARSAQLWPSPSARPAGTRELHLIDDISSTRDGAFSSGRDGTQMQSATAGDVQLNDVHLNRVHLRQTGHQAGRAATQHIWAGREQPGAAMLPKQLSTMHSIHASDAAVQEAFTARNSDAEAAAFASTAFHNLADPQAVATSHNADGTHAHSSSSSSSGDVHVGNTMPGSTVAVAAAVAPASAGSTTVLLDAPLPFKYPIWWHSPMWSGSGYGSEGINYVLSMLRSGLVAARDLYAYNHGDNWVEHVVKSMDPTDRAELELLQSQPAEQAAERRAAIVVCHSLPTNWAFPEPMWFSGAPCPPNPKEFGWVYAIGRTMFETDKLPALFVPRCNAMNEVWVPSEWSRQAFIASGVEASKLVVVPEGVNTTHLDPALFTPLDLAAVGELVFGTPKTVAAMDRAAQAAATAAKAAAFAAKRAEQDARRREAQKRQVPLSASAAQAAGQHVHMQDTLATPGSAGDLEAVHPAAGATAAVVPPVSLETQQEDKQRRMGRTRAAARLLKAEPELGQPIAQPGDYAGSSRDSAGGSKEAKQRPFVFISSFKWETRKGWDVLLEAYLSEFSASDNVELYILTKPFMGSGNGFKDKMRSWADNKFAALQAQEQAAKAAAAAAQAAAAVAGATGAVNMGLLRGVAAAAGGAAHSNVSTFHDGLQGPHRRLADSGIHNAQQMQQLLQMQQAQAQQQQQQAAKQAGSWQQYPTLYVVSSHISDEDFPRFYKAGDAFVLPSRGEGWGRPHVEAMSMGLPVISTNWSGITAYLDDTVGYPIKIEGLVPVQDQSESAWWFRGLKWAQPSVAHLRTLMRQVYTDRAGAARKGAAARQRMIDQYSPQVLARRLVDEFRRVEAALESVGST